MRIGPAVLALLVSSGVFAADRPADPANPDALAAGLGAWAIEQMPGGTVAWRDGALEIEDAAGCTAWYREKLTAPIEIDYDVTVISAGGAHDRVSDLNCFWMAADPRSPAPPFAPGRSRSGKFSDYDSLFTYYVGCGGNDNTTTRFRRYDGTAARPLLPEHDLGAKRFLLEPNRSYHIRLIARDGVAEYYRDGERYFSYRDPAPLVSGWFAIRTVRSHLVVRHLAIRRPSPVVATPLDDVYQLGPDSMPQPGVPHGTLGPWIKLPSSAYPGTLHDYCVYTPAQYNPAHPAALMIFQDGQAFVGPAGDYRVPIVFDNLIYRREMPVTIAVFINPGRRPEQPVASSKDWGDKSTNRPQEYNALDDKYAHVIVDELLPVLRQQFNLSPHPEDHALAGASSGSIAAFTVAWHRPDQFGKVLSNIGSFTNIRGGDAYPDLIRAAEHKPIRIFLEDGVNDLRGQAPAGKPPSYDARKDWHAQNLKMAAALQAKGYDLNYTWGIGTHSNKQGGAILPEALRWLWRDYPRPDDPRDDSNRTLLLPGP